MFIKYVAQPVGLSWGEVIASDAGYHCRLSAHFTVCQDPGPDGLLQKLVAVCVCVSVMKVPLSNQIMR